MGLKRDLDTTERLTLSLSESLKIGYVSGCVVSSTDDPRVEVLPVEMYGVLPVSNASQMPVDGLCYIRSPGRSCGWLAPSQEGLTEQGRSGVVAEQSVSLCC